MALLGDDDTAAAAAARRHDGSTYSVKAAAAVESEPGCDGRPDESPLPETIVTNGGYNISMIMVICGCVLNDDFTMSVMCDLW